MQMEEEQLVYYLEAHGVNYNNWINTGITFLCVRTTPIILSDIA